MHYPDRPSAGNCFTWKGKIRYSWIRRAAAKSGVVSLRQQSKMENSASCCFPPVRNKKKGAEDRYLFRTF